MKERFRIYIYLLALALAAGSYSCADLEVENLNEPDAEKALANPEDVAGLAAGAYRRVHNALIYDNAPGHAMITMADQGSCSWGNFAMQDLSSEPRAGFNNSITYSYIPIIVNPWNGAYSAISSVNDVIQRIEGGLEIGTDGEDNDMLLAWSYFVSGFAHGYLGLIFDKGFVIPYDADLAALELQPWNEVVAAGLALLDQAIQMCEQHTFVLPTGYIATNATVDNLLLGKIANSQAARILMSAPRNKTQNDANDWAKIQSYASKGLTYADGDLMMNYGGADAWYDLTMVYQIYPGWGRTDHRIINLMDPDYPSRWPMDNDWVKAGFPAAGPGEASSPDARLASDFQFLTEQAFRAERGYYHYTHYRLKRYDYMLVQAWYGVGEKSPLMAHDVQTILAEAKLRNGDKDGAIAILNDPAGPRAVRGGLGPISADATADDVLFAIRYERDIELYVSFVGVGYFDMRRFDNLQRGTILHFPVPVTELEIINVPVYTIGGTPDGENVAEKGWIGLDGLTSPVDGWPGM